jgi:hypothetical protein
LLLINCALAADFEEEKSLDSTELRQLCSKLVRVGDEVCKEFQKEYWWGEKLPEVERKVNELSRLIQRASLSGRVEDYAKLEKYITYPFEFGIDDYSGTEDRRYSWWANNFREFVKHFRKVNERIDSRDKEPYLQSYSSTYVLYLTTVDAHIWLSVNCDGFKPTPQRKLLRLPEDRHLCNKIELKIKSVTAKFYK